jgi:hypothetical protein
MKFYTGVGSRKAPADILVMMTAIARKLEELGYTLRSGAAEGSDKAFEAGAGRKCIYLAKHSTPTAEGIASGYHPAWEKCSIFARKLHGRNALQILGDDLNTPSQFVICWTPDGCTDHTHRTIRTGGTGTAISIAAAHNIPIYNLARKDHFERLQKFVQ